MDTKRTARIVGILYILGTLSGVGFSVTDSIRSAQDPLMYISANENQVIIGALFILVMGLALAMIPIMMFSILKKHNESLALGFVVFRGGLETVVYITMALSGLLLLPVAHEYVQIGTQDASSLQALGSLLINMNDMMSPILAIVFIIGALMFYSVLYRSRLVPRWISGWGLISTVPYLTSGFLAMFSLISPTSSIGIIMDLPLAMQEMVLAVWLIVKGFNPEALAVRSQAV